MPPEDPHTIGLLVEISVHNPDELIRRAKEALPEMAEHITRLEHAVEVLLEKAANDLFGADADYNTTSFAGFLDVYPDSIPISPRPTFGRMAQIERVTNGQVTAEDWFKEADPL